jgi:DNA adenine methylase
MEVATSPHSKRGKPPEITRLKGSKLIVFGWYGGKFSHLEWLLPLLPETPYYCEPFAGSGAVLLNRPPSGVETYNDLDGEVVNFFRVLRDQPDDLQRLMALTPFSREEFAKACKLDSELPVLERARRFYVRARQVRTGLAQTASLGRWANCTNTIRAGMSGVVSRWLGAVEQLPEIAIRLMRVQMENRPAVDCIRLYDSRDTLFYCDPPYIHETRGDSKAYAFEMTNEQHAQLADALNSAKGKVALSNYDCPLMDKLYPRKRWKKLHFERTNHSTKDLRTETLWINYNPHEVGSNLEMKLNL